MKLLILSDLHLEFGHPLFPPEDADYDAVVLAGDIHSPGQRAVQWAARTFGIKPVMYVAGNHEFYGREMHTELELMRSESKTTNVRLLDRDEEVIDGVRFLGCTLWTDFEMPIVQPDGAKRADRAFALATANARLNDFDLIEVRTPLPHEESGLQNPRKFTAEDSLQMHRADRAWLRHRLKEPFDGPTVVVTHHAPATGSVAQQYARDWLTPAFASDLPTEFFDAPVLWVHGHTHSAFDYTAGSDCRVVSNPRGYMRRDGSFENHAFDAGFVVAL